ncbi:hypothetical protein NC651_003328 [Populus alba x Populus x berolinensis]|nr:hypothetical protein NC651_003328 [Populus alba x Populus x berolinensis]
METDHVQKTSPCCLCYHFTWKVGLPRLSMLFPSESWALTILCASHCCLIHCDFTVVLYCFQVNI